MTERGLKKRQLNLFADQAWEALYVGLNNYGIKYGRDYKDAYVHNSIMVLSFSLVMKNTNVWKKMSALQNEISQMLELEDSSQIRLGYTGMDYRIEVPKHRSLHDEITIQDTMKFSRGLKAGIGVSVNRNEPEIVDFSKNTSSHVLVSGSSRCGKTNIIKIIIQALITNNSPDDLRIMVIDTEKAKIKYASLVNSAHLATAIIDTEEKAITGLEWAVKEIKKRGGSSVGHKKIIIAVDEAARFKDDITYDLLSYIASAGAESGVHIIAASQYTNKENIGSREFKGNLTRRLCGQVDDGRSSANATGRKGAGAEKLMVPGDFLSVSSNGLSRIATPEILDSDFSSVERGMTPVLRLNQPAVHRSEVTATTPAITNCFKAIDEKLLLTALLGKNKRTGKYLGADVIRELSKPLTGKSIGQPTAHQYVMFAKRLRNTRNKMGL